MWTLALKLSGFKLPSSAILVKMSKILHSAIEIDLEGQEELVLAFIA